VVRFAPVTESRARLAIPLAIAVAALAVYAPVRSLPFLRYDDEHYVTGNPAVQAGLGLDGVRWAFTSFHASNWHPLTWLSHMLDVSLFGASPVGPHVENAVLHALCAVLVYAVLLRLTGARGRSALAGLLWAVHPQHVESVAWVAERKDLLCALCALLALEVWPDWARDGRRRAYFTALGFAALGLLAKPMLVSLPLLLLVLDFWPLARRWSWSLVTEKLPFVGLALGSSLLTMRAQQFAMQLEVPLAERLANAVMAWALTLWQTFVPLRLAVLYPHPAPGHWPAAEVALAAVSLAGVGVLALALRKRAPYLLSGALWYAVALAPTVGLVQVGFQSHADRYSYLPQIGVAWAVVWGAADLLARARVTPRVGVALALAASLALAFGTRQQLRHWQSDVALWQRAVDMARPSYYAETELGVELGATGRFPDALPHLARAVELNPRWARAQANYGFALFLTGDSPAATGRFERAFELVPEPDAASEWHVYYARTLADVGRAAEAVTHYERQLALDPRDRSALFGLAELRATEPPPLRDGAQAFALAERACRLETCVWPAEIEILALAVAASGKPAEAVPLAEEALERARQQNATEQAARIESHLARFRAGESFTRRP